MNSHFPQNTLFFFTSATGTEYLTLTYPCQSQDRYGSGPALGYFFISKDQEFIVAFGEGQNLREQLGLIFISMVWVSSMMAVTEFKHTKPRPFVMLPFPQATLLRQNRTLFCAHLPFT